MDNEGTFEVFRRFKEFDLLRNVLATRFPGLYVPPVPRKKVRVSLSMCDSGVEQSRPRTCGGASTLVESVHQASRALPILIRVRRTAHIHQASHRAGEGTHPLAQAHFRRESWSSEQILLLHGGNHRKQALTLGKLDQYLRRKCETDADFLKSKINACLMHL